ncbi:MAG: hypothetical protein Q8P34_11095 [Bacteroidota bacterium]|nr:hypothetical protein [Bacteroidota bacterium]
MPNSKNENEMMMLSKSNSMLPLQGANCIVAFLPQGAGLSLSKAVAMGQDILGLQPVELH